MSVSDQAYRGGNRKRTSHGWYKYWRKQIRNWTKKHFDSDTADFLVAIPDLFMLCVGLLSDARVPPAIKVGLASAVAYAISPLDLFPEIIMGVPGLIDDAGILILTLHAILASVHLDPETWQEIFRQHWHGDDDPVSVIRKLFSWLMKNGKRLFGKLWWTIRKSHYKSRRSRRARNSRRSRRASRLKAIPIA